MVPAASTVALSPFEIAITPVLLEVKVNRPTAPTVVTVGGVIAKIGSPTVFAAIAKLDSKGVIFPDGEPGAALTDTTVEIVAVSYRVKSVGVNKAVIVELPAETTVPLSPLEIEITPVALDVKLKVP